MLRTRKKDLNLKPNRILDKRSSRGMLYDNEELRLRTIHINDEVDKGQNRIKKLEKENEILKREIWNLRDEYEKLEEILKRVYAAHRDGLTLESPETLLQEFPPQRLRLNSRTFRRGSGISGTTFGGESSMSMYESEDEEMEDLLMIDEDGSQVSVYAQSQALDSPDAEGPSTRCHLALPESDEPAGLGPDDRLGAPQESPPRPHHHWQHLTSVTPDLEVVREESEHTNSNNSPMPRSNGSPHDPQTCAQPDLANLPCCSRDSTTQRSSSDPALVSFNPITIEITTPELPQKETNETSATNSANFQDLGCVTLIPQKYSSRSEIRIGSNGQAEDLETEIPLSAISEQDAESLPVADLLPPQEMKLLGSLGRRKSSMFGLAQSSMPNSTNRVRSQTLSYPTPNTVLVQPQNTDFPSFYQSEPSLSPRRESVSPRRGACEPNPSHSELSPKPASSSPALDWSSVDRNVVIGTIERGGGNGLSGGKSNYKLSDLRAQEIIDELETQFDPTLEEVAGVRMMGSGPIRIFISLRTPLGVEGLVRRGLKLRDGQVAVRLVEASKKCSFLVLSGLPPHLPDSTVITVLNQFGQVVAPLERRIYKGVDISERLARMHLVTKVPTVVNIAGYEVPAKICHCQQPSANAVDTPPTEQSSDAAGQVTNGGQLRSRSPLLGLGPRPSISGPSSTQPTLPAPSSHGKIHQLFSRTLSSAPRLESDFLPSPTSPAAQQALTKRQMSVSNAFTPTTPLATGAGPNTKKPLSRLMRCSPGSLVPPPNPDSLQGPGPAKSFYRSMSFDPRRGSTASRFHTLTIVGEPSSSTPQSPYEQTSGSRTLQPQTSNHSQLGRRETSSLGSGIRKMESGKNLPWCGCWGNGCV